MTRIGRRPDTRIARSVARRVHRSDDSGATLILALIFITVVSLVVASILSFVDTSMRTTIAVRSEAGQAAAADGAAQIAINSIRTSNYTTGINCFGTSATQNLSNFYTNPDGTRYSATIQCTKDDPDSQAGGGYFGGKPTYSLLALGTTAGTGITLNRGLFAGGHGFTLNGDVYSNSTINVSPSLTTDGTVKARGNCSGTITAAATQCNTGTSVDDPNYPEPSGPLVGQSVPNCRPLGGPFQVLTFTPGIYDNAGDLNGITGPLTVLCSKPILKFTPGVYYFDFSALNPTWQISDGFVVGGTPATTLDSNIDKHMPGACVSPIPPTNPAPAGWTPPTGGQGVTFIFGGRSRIDVTNNGHLELCGNYSAGTPPIAIYGNKSDIKDGKGKILVHAGCGGCDIIEAESLSSGEIVVQGTTYIPNGDVNIAVLVNNGQQFNAGVVARSFSVQALFSSSGDIGPVSALPGPGLPGRTVVYLKVFVCTGAGPCGVTGRNQLGVKVGVGDPNGGPTPSKRQVTVYNWSVQRT